MPTIIPDMVVKHPKTDMEMTYLKKKTIDKAIRQKIGNKDVYKTDMHKIYNIIAGQTNEQLWEKAESDATFHVVNTGREAIGYLMILKKFCFSNKS